jgi:hypothetical protein
MGFRPGLNEASRCSAGSFVGLEYGKKLGPVSRGGGTVLRSESWAVLQSEFGAADPALAT